MAATTTVRVRESTRQVLAELAERDGTTIPAVIDRLVERETADEIIAEHNRAMTELRADPSAWREYERELELWDATVGDGLDG